MKYVFVYKRGNNDNFTKDALLDIVPDDTNLSKYHELINDMYISDVSGHDDEELKQFKDECIPLSEFIALYGPVEYP